VPIQGLSTNKNIPRSWVEMGMTSDGWMLQPIFPEVKILPAGQLQ
jgi:hypothetical protein